MLAFKRQGKHPLQKDSCVCHGANLRIIVFMFLLASSFGTMVSVQDNDVSHRQKGDAPQAKGELDSAIVEFREALKLNPNDAEAHKKLAVAFNSKGDLDGAISETNAAIRINPNDAAGHNILGFLLKAKGDLNGSLAEYKEAIRLQPEYELAHNNLCILLKERGGF